MNIGDLDSLVLQKDDVLLLRPRVPLNIEQMQETQKVLAAFTARTGIQILVLNEDMDMSVVKQESANGVRM